MIQQKRKSSTIKSYISAIKAVLKDDGEELNENVYLINALTKACRLNNDIVQTRLPIRKNLIKLLVNQIPKLFARPQPFLTLLYQTLLVTAYYGLFRIGEVTHSQHVILAKDVHIAQNKKKLMFVLHSSKTHWYDVKPQIVKISSTEQNNITPKTNKGRKKKKSLGKDNLCPFTLLQAYIQRRGTRKNDKEQFFIFSDGSPVLPRHARDILKEAIIGIGLDPELYEFHGIRGGRATDLAAMNVDLGTIKILGRWTSGAVFKSLKT